MSTKAIRKVLDWAGQGDAPDGLEEAKEWVLAIELMAKELVASGTADALRVLHNRPACSAVLHSIAKGAP